MKTLSLVCFMVLVVLVLPCSAQPLLQGTLSIHDQQGYMFEMSLSLQNIGDAPFEYSFGSSEQCYYSIDGVEYHGASLPVVLPYTLAAGATDTFEMSSSTVLGSGQHVVMAFFAAYDSQQNPLVQIAPVILTVEPEISVTIGSGAEYALIPIDFFWRSSLYECIYPAAEMLHRAGTVTAISIYPEFVDLALFRNIQIFMCNTPLDDLAAGWIRGLEMTSVLSDAVLFPINQDVLRIDLQSGFLYNGNDNLSLMVFMPINSDYGFHGNPCHADAADPLRSRKVYTDYQTFNPLFPPEATTAQHYGYVPQITFHLIPTNPSGAEDEHSVPQIPLINVYPNPVRDVCTFKVNGSLSRNARVEIYNLKGQLVRKLDMDNGIDPFASWDTRNMEGKACVAGIYLYKVQSGGISSMGRLVLVK